MAEAEQDRTPLLASRPADGRHADRSPQTPADAQAAADAKGVGPRRVTRARLVERRLARSRRRFVLLTAAVALLAGAGVAWFGVMQGRHHDRVAAGVSVCGLDLGGLSPAQARDRLTDWIVRRSLTVARLRTPAGTLVLPLDRLGMTVDVGATVASAMRSGRVRVLGVPLWVGGGEPVEPVVRVRPDTYLEGLVVVRDRVDRPPQDAGLRLAGGRLSVVPAEDGLTVDDIALERALLAALADGRPYDGPVPTRPVTPAVTTADAEQRRSAAAAFVQRPLVLRLRERRVRLRPEVLATLLSIQTGSQGGEQRVTFDNDRTRDLVRRLFAEYERPAVPAQVVIRDGEAVITRSKEGVALDMGRLVADMDAAAAGGGLRAVHVRLKTVYPSPTTDELVALGLTALGSEFTTYYSPENKARAHNIARAAKLVDGTIVRPGATFSLNRTLGPRTENRGFDAAPVIVDGVLRQGVGGGVCQFATTLFNAAFFAGLPIVERHPHTFAIEHYPLGRDAAVSWGSADLRFRNDTGKPIMIRSYTRRGALTVVILGASGREVQYRTGRPRSVRRPSSSRASPRVVYDDDLAGGVVKWENGADGYTITVVRTVRANGRLLFRDRFVSTYQPKDWIKRIGTRSR